MAIFAHLDRAHNSIMSPAIDRKRAKSKVKARCLTGVPKRQVPQNRFCPQRLGKVS